MARVVTVTVVVRKDGRHHCTVENMSVDDAIRWTDAGYHVFQVGARASLWVMRHVGSDRMVSSEHSAAEREAVVAEFTKIEDKRGE